MKTISPQLQTFLLDHTTFSKADLYSIILPNGFVINALSGTNVTSITYPAGLPTSVTVQGTGYPWLTTDPTYPFAGSSGTSPASIAMTQGQVFTLAYASGTIGAGGVSYDASGGPGTPSSAYPGVYVGGPGIPPRWGLIGGFANAAGFLISPPFFIGNMATIGPAPLGCTQLLLGSNYNTYSGNTGSWVINIVAPTYYASQFGTWERGSYSNEATFSHESSSMELYAFIPESVYYPGTSTPLMQSLNSLSGSKVIIQTLFWPTGSSPSAGFSMGTMQLTAGQIGNIKQGGRSKITCEVFDLTYILNRPFPPHLIQSACRHNFCDSGCTLLINNFRSTAYPLAATSTTLYLDFTLLTRANSGTYAIGNLILLSDVIYMCTVAGTAASSPPSFNTTRGALTNDNSVTWTSMGAITGASAVPESQAYPLGYVLGITGQNAGFRRAIKAQTISSGSLAEMQLLWPLPFPVATGDTFAIFAGCDKTTSTCIIYNNTLHFGGMPLVPNPEVAL